MGDVKIRTFDEIIEEKVTWLWKPYIALGKITVIQGDPGNGKTALAIAIAALVSRRQKMSTGNADAFIGNVIYQSGEDNPNDTLKPRLAACRAECSKISDIDKEGENAPIGLILCTEASREQIELMEMDKVGISVAQYWMALPPKSEFERKIKEIYAEAQERLERRKTIPVGQKQLDYFLEKDDEVE